MEFESSSLETYFVFALYKQNVKIKIQKQSKYKMTNHVAKNQSRDMSIRDMSFGLSTCRRKGGI